MREPAGQKACPKLLSLLTPPQLTNTPVLAVDGITISRGVNHGETQLYSSLLNFHS